MTEINPPPERIACRVPGCRRSRANRDPAYYEWVCQKCYATVPPSVRHEHKRAKAEIRRLKRTRCEDMTLVRPAFDRADAAWSALVASASGNLPDDQALRDMGVI